jgi:hypothetical protein
MVTEHGLETVAALASRQGGQAALEARRSTREEGHRAERHDEADGEGGGERSDGIPDGCVQVDGGLL